MHWLLKIGRMSRLKSTGGGSLPRARGRNTSAPLTSSTLARNAPVILAVLRKGVALFYFLSGYQRDGGRFKQRRTRISANAHAVTPCYLSAKVKMLLPEATAI